MLDKKSKKILSNVNKNLGIICIEVDAFLKEINSPIRFIVIEGIRNSENQFNKYKVGRKLIKGKWTPVGRVITYIDGIKKKSEHQKGIAIDIMAIYEGIGNVKEIGFYYYLASLFELKAYELGKKIKWGGFFKKSNGERFIDGMHFQIE